MVRKSPRENDIVRKNTHLVFFFPISSTLRCFTQASLAYTSRDTSTLLGGATAKINSSRTSAPYLIILLRRSIRFYTKTFQQPKSPTTERRQQQQHHHPTLATPKLGMLRRLRRFSPRPHPRFIPRRPPNRTRCRPLHLAFTHGCATTRPTPRSPQSQTLAPHSSQTTPSLQPH